MSRHYILGAGPLALALADELSSRGETGVLADRSGKATVPLGFQKIRTDLSHPDGLFEILAGEKQPIVYQCAAPPYHQWSNFPSLQKAVLTAAARAGARIVLAENLYGYGAGSGEMGEDTPVRPTTNKGRIRAQMSTEALEAHRRGDVAVTISRASDYFGPRVVNSAMGQRAIGKTVAGKVADVLGNPDQLHSWTFIRDAARTMAVLGSDDRAFGHVWHVPNNTAVTARELIELVASRAGTIAKIRPVGSLMLRLVGIFDPGARETVEMLYEFNEPFVVADTKIRSIFGLLPTPLHEAIEQTVAYFQNQTRG